MGDPDAPGSPSREIIRAALLAGCGIAVCNCEAKESFDPGTKHADSCSVEKAGRRMVEILKANRR